MSGDNVLHTAVKTGDTREEYERHEELFYIRNRHIRSSRVRKVTTIQRYARGYIVRLS